MTFYFSIPGSLDLAASLDFGQSFRWNQEDGWWTGVLNKTVLQLRVVPRQPVQGSNITTLVMPKNEVSKPQKRWLEFQESPNTDGKIASHLLHYLGLHDDLSTIHRNLSTDPYLAKVINTFPGLRLLRQDPWECLATFILTAQSHMPRIRRNVENIATAMGDPIQAWSLVFYTFPTPKAIVELEEEGLRELGLGFRAKGLAAAARLVSDGNMNLESLRGIPYNEAKDALLSFPGVGPKIADCILAFSLDQGHAFPVDRWVRRGVLREYLHDVPIPNHTIGSWARERFGNFAAYAQQLIFHNERSHALSTLPLPGSRTWRENLANR